MARFENFEKVSGEELAEKHLIKNGGCYSCPMKCERRVRYEGKNIKGPELETLGLLGPNGAGKSTTMNIMTGYINRTT